jgi:uncharacterized membrane protein YvbJ
MKYVKKLKNPKLNWTLAIILVLLLVVFVLLQRFSNDAQDIDKRIEKMEEVVFPHNKYEIF